MVGHELGGGLHGRDRRGVMYAAKADWKLTLYGKTPFGSFRSDAVRSLSRDVGDEHRDSSGNDIRLRRMDHSGLIRLLSQGAPSRSAIFEDAHKSLINFMIRAGQWIADPQAATSEGNQTLSEKARVSLLGFRYLRVAGTKDFTTSLMEFWSLLPSQPRTGLGSV